MSATYKGRPVRLLAVSGECATCAGTGKGTVRNPDTDAVVGVGDAPCRACNGLGGTVTDLLHPGEPFFLIRGKDELAVPAIAAYAVLYGHATEQMDLIDNDVMKVAQRVADWQAHNPHLTKLPD